jgi:hypothetical protein
MSEKPTGSYELTETRKTLQMQGEPSQGTKRILRMIQKQLQNLIQRQIQKQIQRLTQNLTQKPKEKRRLEATLK